MRRKCEPFLSAAVPSPGFLQLSLRLALPALVLGLISACATIQEPLEGEQRYLPQTAQVAVTRGLQAARFQEWQLAIDYLRAAQREAPRDPRVLFNLAVAYDHGGHDLAAALWFRTYLAADPGSARVAGVRKRIAGLDRRVRRAARILLDEAGRRLKEPGVNRAIPEEQAEPRLLGLQAALGDAGGARAAAARISSGRVRAAALREIANAQASLGDLSGARATAKQIDDETLRRQTLAAIDGAAKAAEEAASGLGSLDAVELWLGLAEAKSDSPLGGRTRDYVERILGLSQSRRGPVEGYRLLTGAAAELIAAMVIERRLENLIEAR